jgi:ABC-type sulfate transport system permease component
MRFLIHLVLLFFIILSLLNIRKVNSYIIINTSIDAQKALKVSVKHSFVSFSLQHKIKITSTYLISQYKKVHLS